MMDIKALRMIEDYAPHLLTVEDRMALRRDDMHQREWRATGRALWARVILGALIFIAVSWVGIFAIMGGM